MLMNKITEIFDDGKRRINLIGPASESTSCSKTRMIEIEDFDSSRRVYVYIFAVGKAVQRTRELLESNMSVAGIAEEIEDEFEIEPNCFSCVLELDTCDRENKAEFL